MLQPRMTLTSLIDEMQETSGASTNPKDATPRPYEVYGNTEREGDSVMIPSEIMAVSSALILFIFTGSTKAENTSLKRLKTSVNV